MTYRFTNARKHAIGTAVDEAVAAYDGKYKRASGHYFLFYSVGASEVRRELSILIGTSGHYLTGVMISLDIDEIVLSTLDPPTIEYFLSDDGGKIYGKEQDWACSYLERKHGGWLVWVVTDKTDPLWDEADLGMTLFPGSV